MEILKWILSGYVFYTVAKSLFTETSLQFTKKIVSKFTISMFLKILATLVLVTITAFFLNQLPILEWGWTKLIYNNTSNITLAPLQNKNLGSNIGNIISIVFLLMLLVVIPKFAYYEEEIFRTNAITIKKIMLRSLGFGLIHCIMGVSIGIGLALSIGGLLFASVYRKVYLQELSKYHILTHDTIEFTVENEMYFSYHDNIMEKIDEVNQNALIHSTSYHTMWNWILISIAIIAIAVG